MKAIFSLTKQVIILLTVHTCMYIQHAYF